MTGSGNINVITQTISGYAIDKALPGGVIEDTTTIGSIVPEPGAFTTLTTTDAFTPGGDITLANGKALKTDTTTAHTALIQAYDVDGTAYKTFGTLTNGNTPSFALAAPSGGSLTINGAVIGGTSAAAATFTTISATDDITVATGKAIKTDTTTAHTLLIQGYDVDGTAYKTFATVTNGNTPSLAIAAPSGGTVSIDGATIGGTTAAAATVTTLTTSGSTTYTTASAGPILKQGANGRFGTFTLNGATPVSVSNTSVTANSVIFYSLKTVGGTVSATHPNILTQTPSTGFTVAGIALDTSTYNYAIIESAA